jgi:hypothetical protein
MTMKVSTSPKEIARGRRWRRPALGTWLWVLLNVILMTVQVVLDCHVEQEADVRVGDPVKDLAALFPCPNQTS